MRWFRKRRSRWADVDFFTLKPERCVEHTTDDANGRVVLLVPRFRKGPLAHWLQPRLRPERAHIKVNLEDRGSWLWQRCDGRRSVAEIVARFKDVFPAEQEQIDHRICMFLYQLEDNGFIRFTNLPMPGAPISTGDKP